MSQLTYVNSVRQMSDGQLTPYIKEIGAPVSLVTKRRAFPRRAGGNKEKGVKNANI